MAVAGVVGTEGVAEGRSSSKPRHSSDASQIGQTNWKQDMVNEPARCAPGLLSTRYSLHGRHSILGGPENAATARSLPFAPHPLPRPHPFSPISTSDLAGEGWDGARWEACCVPFHVSENLSPLSCLLPLEHTHTYTYTNKSARHHFHTLLAPVSPSRTTQLHHALCSTNTNLLNLSLLSQS